MKIKLDFTDKEIRDYLTSKNYKIEDFTITKKAKAVGIEVASEKVIEIATKNTGKKSKKYAYEKIFKREINKKLKEIILK